MALASAAEKNRSAEEQAAELTVQRPPANVYRTHADPNPR
jgi:hypothetical protein